MLLKLLKRDLRLHWDALVVPMLILIVVMGVIGLVNQGAATAGLILMGFLFIPILPMAIHVREASQGTMGDLVSLPVSRTDIVSLRYVEVLLFAAVALGLAHLGTWIALSVAGHKVVHFQVMDRSGLFALGMLLLCFFAYPMPFALRWDGKGISAAFVIFFLFNFGFIVLTLSYPAGMAGCEKVFTRSVMHLLENPGHLMLLIVGLFSLSYLLSLKAFARRDF